MPSLLTTKLRIAARFLDVLMIVVSFAAVLAARWIIITWWHFDLFPGPERILQPTSPVGALRMLAIVLPAWIFGLHVSRSYDTTARLRGYLLLRRIGWGILIGAGTSLLALFLFKQTALVSRATLTAFTLFSPFAVFAGRVRLLRWYGRRPGERVHNYNVLVVALNGTSVSLVQTLEQHAGQGFRLLGVLGDEAAPAVGSSPRHLGTVHDLPRILEELPVDAVYTTGRVWNVDAMRWIADSCEEVGVDFSIDANFLGLQTAKADLQELGDTAILSFSTTPRNNEALVVKRALDVVFSAIALLALSPLFGLIALAIKLQDRTGSVFFGQERSGLNGRTFTMWKFRSMVTNAENIQQFLVDRNEVDGPVFKISEDPRITRVGRVMRKLSLDELPQFWNVLAGDMSLVGPRPPIPAEVKKYERWQMRRLSMKPGLTCLWQIGGRNDIDFKKWMELDLEYIDNWSLSLDLKVLARTPRAVITGTGK